jgi:hypothetical protein
MLDSVTAISPMVVLMVDEPMMPPCVGVGEPILDRPGAILDAGSGQCKSFA